MLPCWAASDHGYTIDTYRAWPLLYDLVMFKPSDIDLLSMCNKRIIRCVESYSDKWFLFLIEYEICLYKHLYFLYIRNPLFPIVVFITMLWQLKVNIFYSKNTFPIV